MTRNTAGPASVSIANPFESALRAVALDFSELRLVPQAAVTARGMRFHPDLVDLEHRVVLEADSYEFHTTKEAHARDCVRYTALTLAGWMVLRFTWDQVMLSPGYVRSVLAELVAQLTDSAAA